MLQFVEDVGGTHTLAYHIERLTDLALDELKQALYDGETSDGEGTDWHILARLMSETGPSLTGRSPYTGSARLAGSPKISWLPYVTYQPAGILPAT